MGDKHCSELCPEVFGFDEDQMIAKIVLDEVPDHLEELVRKAARECDPGAINVEE